MPDKLLSISPRGKNNGAWSTIINPGESVTIPKGYHNGEGVVRSSTSGMRVDDTITDYIHSTSFPILKANATISCGSKKITTQNLISHQVVLYSTAICSALFKCRYGGVFRIYANGTIYASINGSGYNQYSNGAHLLDISDTGSGRVSAYKNI